MHMAHPYLNFDGTTEEAFRYYAQVFGAEIAGIMRYRDFGDNPMGVPDDELDKVAHAALPLGKNTLMGTDVLRSDAGAFTVGTNVYISLDAESSDEADRLFEGLSAGGRVEMALQETDWAEKYGMCTDKFGVQWMVNYEGGKRFALGHAD